MTAAPARDITETLMVFVRALREAGVRADTGRAEAFLRAVDTLDAASPAAVYWAGRVTLCSAAADLDLYDSCFAHFFSGRLPRGGARTRPVTVIKPAMWYAESDTRREPDTTTDADTRHRTAASDVEVLRSADIAALTGEQRAEVARLVSLMSVHRPRRTTRRTAPAARGRVDHPRTLRASLRLGGEPLRLLRRARTAKPRRVVLLLDVSGSMAPYADAFLRLAHAMVRANPEHTEAFTAGTRLTRLTRELRTRDPEAAMSAAGAAIPDWSGGTRLGTQVKEFLDAHGQRGMARGALVVVASDGWERGDAALLGAQMARLARLAHRVVWVNPHKARPGYEPLTGGMRAVLPHVDAFVSGHSLRALEQLATAVIGGRPAPPLPPTFPAISPKGGVSRA